MEARTRLEALPEPYRTTAIALNRCFPYFAGIASTGFRPVKVVGEHPVEFAENFTRSYGQAIDRQGTRTAEQGSSGSPTKRGVRAEKSSKDLQVLDGVEPEVKPAVYSGAVSLWTNQPPWDPQAGIAVPNTVCRLAVQGIAALRSTLDPD